MRFDFEATEATIERLWIVEVYQRGPKISVRPEWPNVTLSNCVERRNPK